MFMQKTFKTVTRSINRYCSTILFGLSLSFLSVSNVHAIPAQVPLYLSQAATPIMMLNMSTDHQLYFKVYDDYGDITDTRPTIGGVANPNYLKNVGDGVADKTYVHGYDYYGYFDSKKCYIYSTANSRFEPSRVVDASANNVGYCNYNNGATVVTNEWSGNFLNWATMTRIDIVRKILYGGLRQPSKDTSTLTVLERAYLPSDAHAFTKYYDGADLAKLTPMFTSGVIPTGVTGSTDSGITFCNVTGEDDGQYSQTSTKAPLIRVAKGNYSLWASSERWQCRWGTGSGSASTLGKNGNKSGSTQIYAYDYAPVKGDTSKSLSVTGLNTEGEFVVRVQVCKDATLTEDNCRQYPSATYRNKPAGLLQIYGETNELNFGLITGSHGRNKDGGVLRKNVGNILDEVNADTDGTFKSVPAGGGIINTLNLLRMFGYSWSIGDAGSYSNTSTGGDSCTYGLSGFPNGNCSNWGNPQSEIYYESLRYLSGLTATPAFTWSGNEDNHYIAGLTHASWTAPVTNNNYCAPLSILQFNSSTNSYDSGTDSDYPGISGIGLADTAAMDAKTDEVGAFEGITNTFRFVGKIIGGTGADVDQLCTAKKITALSKVSGTCPDSPRLEGGYGMVGLARYARDVGLKINGVTKWMDKNRYGNFTNPVRTYAVALAPSVPKVEVPVPGSTTGQKIIIQPACRNISNSPATNCAIVDFKVVDQTSNKLDDNPDFPETKNISTSYGILYMSWEDGEQGGDYDQDMWGVIKYAITSSRVYIKTQVLAQSSTQPLGFGYILTGTKDIVSGNTSDGFHVHSGILNFQDGKECLNTDNNRCTCRLGTGSDTAFDICAGGSNQQKTDIGGRKKAYAVADSATTASFLPSPLYYAAKWGGYDSKFEQQNLANLDTAIKARNPSDSFFYATDPSALEVQLKTAFESISKDIRSAGGVATNNPRLSNDAFLFQTKFNTSDWSGELLALKFDTNGLLLRDSKGDPIVQTSTTDSGKMPINELNRTVYTNKLTPSPISNSSYPVDVVSLSWANLNSAQQNALRLSSEASDATYAVAKKRVDWLLGNAKDEQSDSNNAGVLRSRTSAVGARNILGDLVNSSPVYVGADDYNFSRLPAKVSTGQTYDDFVKTKAKLTPLIFVGSNDGMVHAFNASYKDTSGNIQTSNMFKEQYAYIPQIVFSLPASTLSTDTRLAKLSGTDYGRSGNPHKYIVDGPIVTSDVWIPDDVNNVVGVNSTGKWKTIIVGTLGAGGRGIYALDITDRTKPVVLFEFTDLTCKVAVTDPTTCSEANKYYPSLGYVLGAPVITQLPNKRFAVIFGNGDTTGTAATQKSSLFVIDIAAPFNPAFSKVIPTDNNDIAVAGIGLSAAEVLPNSIGQGVKVYAGDLSGNLWAFDLSSSNPDDWIKTTAHYLLFQAKDLNNVIQPIFAAPTIGYNLEKKSLMVYFGTGKYYDTGDNVANAAPVHSLYAIADIGTTVLKGSLKPKGIVTGTSSTTPSFATRSEDLSKKPTWSTNNGWYLDLPSTGERITTTPVLIDDKVIFPTLVPSPDACVAGGNNWIMEMTATGVLPYKNKTVLDPTSNKYRNGLILGNLATGRKADGNGSALGSTTDGAIIEEKMSLEPGTTGRQSWRQLR